MKRKSLTARFVAAILAAFCLLSLTACRDEREDTCEEELKPTTEDSSETNEEREELPSFSDLEDVCIAKPVIYLYPQVTSEVTVKLTLSGDMTCSYPAYEDGWTVTARPDGTLSDASHQTYNYLYWEGTSKTEYDFSHGFCVAGQDTAAFLEKTLSQLGLNRKEANEFIVYWLPQMEKNPYNLITFPTEQYSQEAQLSVSPAPDTVLRVFMAWKPSDCEVELLEQKLTAPERTGFTVVEWGGRKVQ